MLKLVYLSGRTSTECSNEIAETEVLLSKKRGMRWHIKSHSNKLEKEMTAFLYDFEGGNFFHISNAKWFKSIIPKQNKHFNIKT